MRFLNGIPNVLCAQISLLPSHENWECLLWWCLNIYKSWMWTDLIQSRLGALDTEKLQKIGHHHPDVMWSHERGILRCFSGRNFIIILFFIFLRYKSTLDQVWKMLHAKSFLIKIFFFFFLQRAKKITADQKHRHDITS